MKHILIFAGTTEGKELMEKIKHFPVEVFVSVATEYGKECLLKETEEERAPYAKHGEVQAGNLNIIAGRMKEVEMKNYISRQEIDLVVDATHPFAREVTKNYQRGMQGDGSSLYQASEKAGAERGRPHLCLFDRRRCRISGEDGGEYPDYHRKQGAFCLYKAYRLPEPLLCKSTVHARIRGGKRTSRTGRGII